MDQDIPKNTIDKAADSANRGIDVTKKAANSALDAASAKVESLRNSLSPAIDHARRLGGFKLEARHLG